MMRETGLDGGEGRSGGWGQAESGASLGSRFRGPVRETGGGGGLGMAEFLMGLANYAAPVSSSRGNVRASGSSGGGGGGGGLHRESITLEEPGYGDAVGGSYSSPHSETIAQFQSLVEARVAAAGTGVALLASSLGSSIPRASRPHPEAGLLDQVEDYVPGVIVERGGRGGGRIALASDGVAVFGIQVRSALRSAEGGFLDGSVLGSRVALRLGEVGERLSDQVATYVDGVAVERYVGGDWRAVLVDP
jgi:hypothetical protein